MKKVSIGIPDGIKVNPYKVFFEKNRQENFVLNYGSMDFLSHMLQEEMLHVSLVSMLDYLKNSKHYHIIQSSCISTQKASGDIVLFSKYSFDELENKTIYTPYKNEDAKMLLRIILKEKNIKSDFCDYKKIDESFESCLVCKKNDIEKLKQEDYFIYDLAQIWYETIKLPYIFGLWVCYKDWMEHSKDGYELTKHYLKEAILLEKNDNISYKFTQSHIETIYKFREKVIRYKL